MDEERRNEKAGREAGADHTRRGEERHGCRKAEKQGSREQATAVSNSDLPIISETATEYARGTAAQHETPPQESFQLHWLPVE